jgi:choline dehydrogenase
MEYDYVIVGAGTAGCLLAHRLSDNARNQVLLLEAGGSDGNPLQRIPAASAWLNHGNSNRDWQTETMPDPSRCERVGIWSRGRILGGSSSINGMITCAVLQKTSTAGPRLATAGGVPATSCPFSRRLRTMSFLAKIHSLRVTTEPTEN